MRIARWNDGARERKCEGVTEEHIVDFIILIREFVPQNMMSDYAQPNYIFVHQNIRMFEI